MIDFTPLESFYSPDLKSEYCVGLGYTARPSDKLLRSLLPQWEEAGKIAYGRPPAAQVEGG